MSKPCYLGAMNKVNTVKKLSIFAGSTIAATISTTAILEYELFHKKGRVYEWIKKPIVKKSHAEESATDVVKPLTKSQESKEWVRGKEWEDFEVLSEDGTPLKAHLLMAEKPSNVYVLYLHGYRGEGKGFTEVYKFLNDNGWNVFAIDHVAHGDSGGNKIGFGYYDYKNAMYWLSFMLDKFGNDIKIIVYGISMGGASVLMMNGEDLPDNVKFTIADCGYSGLRNEFEYCLDLVNVPKKPIIAIMSALMKLDKLGYTIDDVDTISAVKKAKKPILFIHGGDDNFVPVQMCADLYSSCASEKDILIVDGAWHGNSYMTDTEAYEQKVNSFAEKYL